MADQSTTEAVAPEPAVTFAGSLVDTSQPQAEESPNAISLGEDEEVQPKDPISLDDEGGRKAPDRKVAQRRAGKLDFAMGENSPGIGQLENEFKSGGEDSLRTRLAQDKDNEDRVLKAQVIQEKAAYGDLSANSIKEMADVTRHDPKNSPDTIIEQMYASNYVKTLMGLGEGAQSVLGKAFEKDPKGVVDKSSVLHEVLVRQESLKSIKEDVEDIKKNQSYVGYGVDFVKGFVPGYREGKYWLNNKESTDSYLAGNIVDDKIAHYYSLPPDEMYRQVKKDMLTLAQDNPQLAGDLIDGLIKHSTSDKFWDNVMTGVDVASALPFGTAAKAVKGIGAAEKLAATGVADAAKIAASKAGKVAEGTISAEARSVMDEASTVFKAAAKANADPDATLGEILTNVGDVERGARVQAARRIDEVLEKGDPLGDGKTLRSQATTYNNPDIVARGGSENLSAPRVQRIIDALKGNADSFREKIADLVKVGRLPEEALQIGFRETEEKIRSAYTHLQDSVLDVRTSYNRPEDNLANVGSVTMRLGKPDGTLFTDFRDAEQAAKTYGLNPQEYAVRPTQEGLGYTVDITKTIDETTDGVRSALIQTKNDYQPSFGKVVFGWLRNGIDRTNPFQAENAQAATHGFSALQASLKDMANVISKMKNHEKTALTRIMNADKHATAEILEDGTIIRGTYANTIHELDQNYISLIGRPPSEREVEAYFTARQINDMEYTVRNLGVYRDRARQGIENFRLSDKMTGENGQPLFQKSKEFGGRYIDKLPISSKHDAGVVIHTEGAEPRILRLHGIDADAAVKAEIADLQAKGYKLIQVENPMIKVFGEKFGDEPVSYLVTKDMVSRPLDWNQIPYRPGWHTEYPHKYYVKQPVIRRAGEGRFVAEGDQAALGFNTLPEAQKYAKNMDAARLLLKEGKHTELNTFLRAELPYDPATFRKLFQKNEAGDVAFSLDDGFYHVPSGSNVADVHGKALRKTYGDGFQDLVRSPHNLFQNVDKKFMGRRDNPLLTVNEKGSELNPLGKTIEPAAELDPMESVSRAMSNVVRSRFFTDHKIQAMESWIEKFGHLLGEDPELVKSNPLYYLHNGTLKYTTHDFAEVRVAQDARRALIELLGTKSPAAHGVEATKQKLVDSIYNIGGQKASESRLAKFLQSEADPTRFMRAAVFHENIGLYNPQQLFLNAMTMTHTIALSPRHGASSTMIMPLLRYAFINPSHLDSLAQKASKLGYGTPEHFKEAFAEMKRSGKMVIEGEYALRNDLAEPTLTGNKLTKFLEGGLAFFKEGERWSRVSGYATAYREWRSANPTKVMTEADRRFIMNRSSDLTANMTRDANAFYQSGILAIPTQFYSYHVRLAEQLLSGGLGNGGRLTRMEKARAIAVYSAIYGVPIGAGGSFGASAFLGGLAPLGEGVKNAMIDRNISFGETADAFIQGGLMDVAATLITGKHTELSAKAGPTGGQALSDFIGGDKTTLEMLFGASGGAASKMKDSMSPVFMWLTSPFREESEKYTLTNDDILAVLRNIKSVDKGLTAWYGLTAGKLMNKQNKEVGDVNSRQAILQFITGAVPYEQSRSFVEGKQDFDRNKMMQKVMKNLEGDFRSMVQAQLAGDQKLADTYAQNIYTQMQLANIRPDERAKIYSQIHSSNLKTVNSIHYNHIFKNAPADKVGERMDNELARQKENQK